MVKNLPARQETWIQSLGWEDSLEKGMATHFSTLAWRIPWTEEPGGLQSMGSHRVGYDWATDIEYTCIKTDISSSLEGNTYISHCWFFFMFFFFFRIYYREGRKLFLNKKLELYYPVQVGSQTLSMTCRFWESGLQCVAIVCFFVHLT